MLRFLAWPQPASYIVFVTREKLNGLVMIQRRKYRRISKEMLIAGYYSSLVCQSSITMQFDRFSKARLQLGDHVRHLHEFANDSNRVMKSFAVCLKQVSTDSSSFSLAENHHHIVGFPPTGRLVKAPIVRLASSSEYITISDT